MGKLIETTIKDFSGGMVNDPRDKRGDVSIITTNFDIYNSPRLIPRMDVDDFDQYASTSRKRAFVLADKSGTWYLYALGEVSGTSYAEIQQKNLSDNSNQDFSDNQWLNPLNNEASTGSTDFNLFVYYAKTGLIYGAAQNTPTDKIWAFSPAGAAFDENIIATNGGTPFDFTNMAQGLVFSTDDILYIPYDNIIAKNNNGTWDTTALVLPSEFKINSICEYGDYLAIAVAPVSGIGSSKVFLWDRDSSVATLSENINWGSGELKILEEVGGYLIGISVETGNLIKKAKIIFKYLSGNKAIKYTSLLTDSSNLTLRINKQKLDDKVYFLLTATINGVIREGVFSFGKSGDGFKITHEQTPSNDTSLGNGVVLGFFKVNDYFIISFTDNSAVWSLNKTNAQTSYTATSIYEKMFNTIDSKTTKKLIGITVMTEYLPTAGQVVLKYKKDEETSWTTIFTNTTDNSISYSAVKTDSGDNLPQYKEIQFRIESTGGAVITGLKFKEEVIGNDKY